MTDIACDCWTAAILAMGMGGPKTLIVRAQTEALDRGWKGDVGVAALCAYLASSSLNDTLRKTIHLAISKWDIASGADPWTESTAPRSGERRARVYELLGFAPIADAVRTFDELFPLDHLRAVVISEEFIPWYTTTLREERGTLYYSSYEGVLRGKNWPATA